MNRTILFRGKRIDSGKWVYGSLISRPFGYSENQKEYSAIIIFDKHDESHFNGYLELEVIPETVGQFTGLTDKNGTKIFEGDILKYKPNHPKYDDNAYFENIVEFASGQSLVGWRMRNKSTVVRATPYKFSSSEIIGTIHDNPINP